MSTKEKLIKDIQNLLNSNHTVSNTEINPSLLEFMDEKTLKSIISSLLDQVELSNSTVDIEWLNQFKSDIN
jgi:hypothetical protein